MLSQNLLQPEPQGIWVHIPTGGAPLRRHNQIQVEMFGQNALEHVCVDFLQCHVRQYTDLVVLLWAMLRLSCGSRWGQPDIPTRKLRRGLLRVHYSNTVRRRSNCWTWMWTLHLAAAHPCRSIPVRKQQYPPHWVVMQVSSWARDTESALSEVALPFLFFWLFPPYQRKCPNKGVIWIGPWVSRTVFSVMLMTWT